MKNNTYIAVALLLLFLLWLYFGSESKPEKNKVILNESNETITEKQSDTPIKAEIKPKASMPSQFTEVPPTDKPFDPPAEKPDPIVKNQSNILVKPVEIIAESPEVTKKPHPPYDTSRPPPSSSPLEGPEQYPPDDGSLPPNAR